MDISLFEVIGPVMVGPSSSGTAGMARLGLAAREFLDGPVKSIDLKFHPRNSSYAGLRSHLGLIGGVLGIREYDPQLRHAMELAKQQGITLSASRFKEPLPKSGLTVRLSMTQVSGKRRDVTGVSVGGGSIAVIGVDDFDVELSSTARHLFVWADTDVSAALETAVPQATARRSDSKNGKYLFYMDIPLDLDAAVTDRVLRLDGVTEAKIIEPFLQLGYLAREPLFTTYAQLIARAEQEHKTVPELAIEYEIQRSGRSRRDIWDQMAQNLAYMRETVETGLTQDIKTLFGFGTGCDGKK